MARSNAALVVVVACVACGARTELSARPDSVLPYDSSPDLHAAQALDANAPYDSGPELDVPQSADADVPVSVIPDASEPTDVTIVDVPPSRAVCASLDAGGGGRTCQRRLRVLSLTPSSSSCWVDVVIAVGEVGMLTWACDGGPGTLSFGEAAFRGAVLPDGRIELCTGTQFDWSDGCRWSSAQYVTGRVTDPRLTFTYAEAPMPSQQGCTSSCSAVAALEWE